MNKKIGILISIMLLFTAIYPVAGLFDNQTKSDNWWPMFRYDSANTGSSIAFAPNNDNLKWKKTINEEIYSSVPIVYDNKLYLSTGFYYGDFERGKYNDIDEILGNKISLVNVLESLIEKREDYIGGLYCMDSSDGSSLWNFSMVAPNDPVIIGDKVYVSDLDLYSYDSKLYCLNSENGDEIWNESVGELIVSPTIASNEKIFINCLNLNGYSGSVKCYDLQGSMEWSYSLPPDEVIWFSAPAVYDNKVFCISNDMNSYYNGKIFCLNAETGKLVWSEPLSSIFFYIGSPSPVVKDDKVYIYEFDIYSYGGNVNCLNATNGDMIWSYDVGLSFATPALYKNSLITQGFDLYSYGGHIFNIDANNGALVWESELSGFSYFPMPCSPVCSDNKIYLAAGAYSGYSTDLSCYTFEDGNELWSYSLDDITISGTSIADDKAFIFDYSGNIYAFEDPIKIIDISGGFMSVKAEIKNNIESDFNDVSWSISVIGGMFGYLNKTISSKIGTLTSDNSELIRSFPIFGFGNIKITVEVDTNGINPIKKVKEGFALGPFIVVQ